MKHYAQLFAGLGLVLAITACNKAPTTPQPEPAVKPETPAPVTTPPSTGSTAPDADKPMPPTPSPSSLPPPTTPPAQEGGGSK